MQNSQHKTAIIFFVIFSALFVFISFWLNFTQNNINKQSNIATLLTFSQQYAADLQYDTELVLVHLTEKNFTQVNQFIDEHYDVHKSWLAELLSGAHDNEPLAMFGTKYLSLLTQLKVDKNTELLPNESQKYRKLMRLIEDISLNDENIIGLFKRRMLVNLEQLNSNTALSKILMLCLLINFFSMVIVSYWLLSSQSKSTHKNQRMALFFTHYPHLLLRLSNNGRIKYFNNKANSVMSTHRLNKYKLLPANISDQVAKVIKDSKQIIYFNHTIADVEMRGELRFCKESQQIYVTLIQAGQAINLDQKTITIEQAS
ncbi:MAG: hypothetical protein HRU24_02895 [Gammaproteobacteria bacterium]|nr:hypothetical protein [Gammaproteobacteria bacterium]